MAYDSKRRGGSRDEEYDNNDRGYFAKNAERTSDNAPSHKGKVTLSPETIAAVVAMDQDGVDCVLYLAGWPAKKPGMLTVKIEPPQEYREGGAPKKQASRGREEARRPAKPDNRRKPQYEEEDDDAPF